MINAASGARVLLATRPIDFRRPVLWRGYRLAQQAKRPREDIGLG